MPSSWTYTVVKRTGTEVMTASLHRNFLNRMAEEGWEYHSIFKLPTKERFETERRGLFGRKRYKEFPNYNLVFRRQEDVQTEG